MAKTLAERFWEKVDTAAPNQCWEWLAGTCGRYGRIGMPTSSGQWKMVAAHRVAWELSHGPIPKGLYILHKCDNPPCVNPGHLFLGTHQDNMTDMKQKQRASRRGKIVFRNQGELHPRAKLTEESIAAIRSSYTSGERVSVIARRYEVSIWTIYSILSGKRWGHIPEPSAIPHVPAVCPPPP